MTVPEKSSSPKWNTTTKLVVALTIVALVVALIFRFRYILAPLLLAFILSYLFHPVADFFYRRLKVPWRLITTIIYLLLFLIIIGLLTWSGISIVEQVQNLIQYIEKLITDLPVIFANLSSKPLTIGPFSFNLSKIDLNNVWTQLQGIMQPLLARLGSLIGSLASGVGSTLTWIIFILIISYFISAESKGTRAGMLQLQIPNYEEDLIKMGNQLSHIWNAFLRGQLLIFIITVAFYSLLLGVLGVHYFFLLALLAGLARFVPYVGPFIAWTTYALVALFQTNYFNLLPLPYALIVVGAAWLSDVIMDSYVSPRVMSDALAVHPAAVLVMVIISASLFGVVGVLLSAPVLASLQLIFTYVSRKLTDQDPWIGLRTITPPPPFSDLWHRFTHKIFRLWNWIKKLFTPKPKSDQ